jgi:hypothetical protein
MIVVRDVFRLKFGQSRQAVAVWKEGRTVMEPLMKGHAPRIMTDLTGQFYTLVFESSYKNLHDYEELMKAGMANEDWKKWYQKFLPFVESGYREIFSLVE